VATASILGAGLIGTSIALGLERVGWATRGWDPDQSVLEAAASRGSLIPVTSRAELFDEPGELLVIAIPVQAEIRVLAALQTEVLVTDVSSVKHGVVRAGRHLPRFVPGHPMAGREVSGPAAASAALFRGAAWVLVTDHAADEDLTAMESIVAKLGARPLRMSASEHDDAVAVVSHLPQVLASALVREAAATASALDLAAGGFRDLTRVASSDPDAWTAVLVANGPDVGETLRRFASRLEAWADAVESGSDGELRSALAEARSVRRTLAPPVVAVAVALADRPGELARVGHALEVSHVDVRDLQLRHAPHGGGGVLSLFVRPGEAEPLRSALAAEGLLVVGAVTQTGD